MQGTLIKYWTKFLSLIILISFISTTAGLCELYMTNCNVQSKTSCCCKDSSKDFSAPIKIEQKCCCEIKEAPAQTAEITLSITETLPKSQSYFLKTNYYNLDNIELKETGLDFSSVHLPTKEDIYIFYSNLRI